MQIPKGVFNLISITKLHAVILKGALSKDWLNVIKKILKADIRHLRSVYVVIHLLPWWSPFCYSTWSRQCDMDQTAVRYLHSFCRVGWAVQARAVTINRKVGSIWLQLIEQNRKWPVSYVGLAAVTDFGYGFF